MDGKFQHFAGRETRGKFGRMIRGAQAGFKLQVARRRQRGRSGNRGTAWVCFWFLTHRCLSVGSESEQGQHCGIGKKNPSHLSLDALVRYDLASASSARSAVGAEISISLM